MLPMKRRIKVSRDRMRLFLTASLVVLALLLSMYLDFLFKTQKIFFLICLNLFAFFAIFLTLKEIPKTYTSYSHIDRKFYNLCAAINSVILVIAFLNTSLEKLSTPSKIFLSLTEIVMWLFVVKIIVWGKSSYRKRKIKR
jgi:hypothetical protein